MLRVPRCSSYRVLRRRVVCYGGALLFSLLWACHAWLSDGSKDRLGRRLASSGSCSNFSPPVGEWERRGGVVVWFAATIYLFLGIAIVCDDYFVASLEAVSSALGLSENVAGATFMAAGSSAPELFSSLVSLVNPSTGSDLGVGTIVGSAIFNIFVIIGATGVSTGMAMQLDWRPMVRDVAFYTVAIASIIGIFSDGKIYWYEGLISLALYAAYISFMKYNEQYMDWCERHFPRWMPKAAIDAPAAHHEKATALPAGKGVPDLAGTPAKVPSPAAPAKGPQGRVVPEEVVVDDSVQGGNVAASGGQDRGKADGVEQGALAGDGSTEGNEVQQPPPVRDFKHTMTGGAARWQFVTQTKVMSAWKSENRSGTRGDGGNGEGAVGGGEGPEPSDKGTESRRQKERILTVNENRFASAITAMVQAQKAAKRRNLTKGQVRALALQMQHPRKATTLERGEGGRGDVEAGNLPRQTMGTGAAGSEAEGGDDDDDEGSLFLPPKAVADWPVWLLSLPWYAMLTVTIPDCSTPRWSKWYLLTFTMSICWIGAISWFMVEWCGRIGCILKIPDIVMGVTVLAMGTSVPDLLSSMIVAKQGMGDMAVANAVGSNVFDIWIGLGAPWFFVLVAKQEVNHLADKDQLWWNVLILFGSLAFYMIYVAVDKFRLRPSTGYVFLSMYVLYALYEIVLVWVLDIYGQGVSPIKGRH